MGMEIVKSPNGAPEWESKIELIKQTVAKGATDTELQLFLYQAKKSGLDPLAKQIHCVKRWNNKLEKAEMSIQTGIDGYRLIADRTGLYAGNDDYEFDDPEKEPKWAKATVYKMVQGQRCAFSATARWSQYYPGEKQGFMWKKMPHVMLGKCAEALALRKAFPADLAGIYTSEEMAQAGEDVNSKAEAPEPSKCEHCGTEIVGGKWGDHKYNADQVIILSRRLHDGKEYCGDCLQKLKKGDKKPEQSDAAVEIVEVGENEYAVQGMVTGIFPGNPFAIKCGDAVFQVWHKNTLVPHFKEAKGLKIDVFCKKSNGFYCIERINSIGKQRFVNNQPVTELEASTAV